MRSVLALVVLLAMMFQHMTVNSQAAIEDVLVELDWNADGTRLAGANLDGIVYIWDQNMDLVRSLIGHSGSVTSAQWSPREDNIIVSVSSNDSYLLVWNTDIPEIIEQIDLPGFFDGVFSVRWNADGSKLAVLGWDVFQIWDAEAWVPITNVLTGTLYDLVWSTSGDFFIVAGLYDMMRIEDSSLSVTPETNLDWWPIASFSWFQNGGILVGIGRTRPFVSIWSASPLSQNTIINLNEMPVDVVFIDDIHSAVAQADGIISIVDTQSAQVVEQIDVGGELRSLAWNNTLKMLAVGGRASEDSNYENGLREVIEPQSLLPSTVTPTPTDFFTASFTPMPTNTPMATATSTATVTPTPTATATSTPSVPDSLR